MKACKKCGEPVAGIRCVPCAKAYQAAWHLKTYAERKDALLARNEKWRAENLARVRELERARHAADPELRRTQKRARYKADPVKHMQRSRDWYRANPEKGRELGKASAERWRKENPARANAAGARKRAAHRRATPAWANGFFIAEAYDLARLRTQVTGRTWDVDHIVPLRSRLVCGLHVESNLQVIPSPLNNSKGNRYWPDMP